MVTSRTKYSLLSGRSGILGSLGGRTPTALRGVDLPLVSRFHELIREPLHECNQLSPNRRPTNGNPLALLLPQPELAGRANFPG